MISAYRQVLNISGISETTVGSYWMELLSCLQETGYLASESEGLLLVKNDGHTCERIVSEWRMRRVCFLALSQSMDHSDLFFFMGV